MRFLLKKNLVQYLLQKADQYNQPSFFYNDPVIIPRLCYDAKDVEIMAFFMALMAWGKRELIVRAGKKLLAIFENAPYDFIMHASAHELKRCEKFVYRTLNGQDIIELVLMLRTLYQEDKLGLAKAFNPTLKPDDSAHAYVYIDHFLSIVDTLLVKSHTRKHFPLNNKTSPAKRLNLFLRWMVRKDERGIDLGLWYHYISQSSLVIPLDVHVMRTLKLLGLTNLKHPSRNLALQITSFAKEWVPSDPCLLDYAFFGLSYFEQKINRF